MATPKQVTEPAKPVATVTEPAKPDQTTERVYDSHKLIRVMDKNTKQVVRRPVPETWVDGRFPNLVETPSQKAGN